MKDLEQVIRILKEIVKQEIDTKLLEDRAYLSLPRLLKRDFGIELKERLVRKYIKNKKGERIEINILGKGKLEGKELWKEFLCQHLT